MNRPNKDKPKYWNLGGFKLEKYNDDLESYCDKLETINNQTKLALKKACDILQDIEKDGCYYCPFERKICVDPEEQSECMGIGGHCSKERWEEWLLENV